MLPFIFRLIGIVEFTVAEYLSGELYHACQVLQKAIKPSFFLPSLLD
jgi:hypothetical protein